MMIMGTVLISFKSSRREEHSWNRCSDWCLSCCLHRFMWCCTRIAHMFYSLRRDVSSISTGICLRIVMVCRQV